MTSSSGPTTYDSWTREELISRLKELDNANQTLPSTSSTRRKAPPRGFNFTKHPKRKIALKFCYYGWDYAGLAFQNTQTTLPTVEGVLFEAFAKARLIDPEKGFEGCGWEKCGRTDRGVSAAGQVISLWVRSADHGTDVKLDVKLDAMSNSILADADSGRTSQSSSTEARAVIPPKNEHNYVAILNRLLPPTIRILAWSPVSPEFSARFSCSYRHYKYFFSSDVIPGPPLDVDRMRSAASRLIGEHDFRNLCKVDPGKQITRFKRNVMRADVEPVSVDQNGCGMYVFNLIGSAFLYHQVRHIMAVLFMVGSGVEDPEVISALMNVDGSETNDLAPDLETVRCKPEYQMADALPLVLWDCGYPEGAVDWRINTLEHADPARNQSELYQQLHSIYTRSQIVTTLNEHFLIAASRYHTRSTVPGLQSTVPKYCISLGGGNYKTTIKYVPLLQRNRLDPVEVINERWRLGKGARRGEHKKVQEEVNDGEGDE